MIHNLKLEKFFKSSNDQSFIVTALQVKGLINKEESKPPPTSSPLVSVSPVVQTKPPKNSTVKPAYITPVTSHVQVINCHFSKIHRVKIASLVNYPLGSFLF